MSIIKIHKQKNFTTISNRPLNDPNLSMKARGIWATLLSKPDDWQVYVSQLVKTCKDGKASIYSGLKELKEAGYIEHVFIRDEAGKMIRGEYIVYEDPIDVKTPVDSEPEPYTENRDTVNRDTENPPLLNTDVKINTDDDKTAPPQDQTEAVVQESKKRPSSPSFSENETIKILTTLMTLVPEQFQKPSVEKTIGRGLNAHSEDYVKLAILYTITHSNGGTWQKFKAYLGKCIDSAWHDGWEPDTDETSRLDLEAVKAKFKQIPVKSLRQLADVGNQQAIEELERRKK